MTVIINILIRMLWGLSLTVVIELGVALLLGIREKNDILNVLIINCITNPILNYIMMIVVYLFSSSTLIYFLLFFCEIIVVYFEYKFYRKKMIFKKINLLLLSAVLNLFSVILGLIISIYIF